MKTRNIILKSVFNSTKSPQTGTYRCKAKIILTAASDSFSLAEMNKTVENMMNYIRHELQNQIGSKPNCSIEINTNDFQIVPVDGRNINKSKFYL